MAPLPLRGMSAAARPVAYLTALAAIFGGADRGRIAFAATDPSAGRYRLFLQFRHDGRVHTAALTEEVATA
jgi:hypothetical protein